MLSLLPGGGDLAITGATAQGPVLPLGVIHLAAYSASSTVATPAAKLGTSEPASAYGKVGLLQDMFTITESDPGVVE